MAIVRTARGTASSKVSGTTLTIPSFTVPAGHSLIVGAAYDNAFTEPTSVIHAGRNLNRRVQQDNASRSIHSSMWVKGEYHKEQTGVCILTWSSAIVERAAFATSFDRVQKVDDRAKNSETMTTTPGTTRTGSIVTAGSFVVGTRYEVVTVGSTDFTVIGAVSNTIGLLFVATGTGSGTGDAREALNSTEGLAICCFGAEGPVEDTVDSPRIRDNGSLTTATIGQRVGTTGGSGQSNITANEVFLELTTRHFTRGVLGGTTTSRRWVNTMLVLEPRVRLLEQGVTPSDIIAVEAIADNAGENVNHVVYGFDEGTGEQKAYIITDASLPSVFAVRDNETGTWSAP